MNYSEKLAAYAAGIESALDLYLPVNGLRQDVLTDAMRYSALSGGKRLRGALLLEFCRVSGGDTDAAMLYACAVEMVHAYSLIHDDLPCMDDDDLRRGKPSNHIVYGEATALLAGDALLTRAFEIGLGESAVHALGEGRAIRLMRELADSSGFLGMAGGQYIDLYYDSRRPDRRALYNMIALKTGALFRAACRMGVIAAGECEELIRAADTFANCLGLAFQIKDDMLDVEGDAAVLGKAINSDIRRGKTTFTGLIGLEACRAEVAKLTAEALEAAEAFHDNDFLKECARSLARRDA